MQFIMPILIAILLGVLALAYVLYPFYRRSRPLPRSSAKAEKSALPSLSSSGEPEASNGHKKMTVSTATVTTDSEQEARTALQEIELDFQLGNISEADYRTLRERYLRRALVALKSRYDRQQELDNEKQ
jgi:flagellar basal body-associated protein FliL